MVVGDRLWLFSQTPAGPAPLQSIMLNSPPPANAAASAIAPLAATQLRAYPGSSLMQPMANASVIESARNAILSRGQPLNYALPPYLTPRSPASSSSTNLTSSPRYLDYATASNLYQNSPSPSDSYLQMKYNVLNNLAMPETETSTSSNGLAELERVFGDTNANFLEHKPLNGEKGVAGAGKTDFGFNGLAVTQRTIKSGNESDSESSEIDCEQIDDD